VASYRTQQLADIVRGVVARFAAQVPPTVATLVSVRDVLLSPDFAYADVLISAIEHPDAAVSYLKKEHMREMKKALASEFLAHKIPILRLKVDTKGREAQKLEQLIDSL